MVSLNSIFSTIQPSPTLAAAAKARALKAQGRDIVSFTVGEPDFDTPEHVKDAARDAITKGFTKYVAVEGIAQLREVISAKLLRDQGLEYSPREIVVTNGGKQALATTFAVTLDPGDEVIIPAPYWTSFPDMVLLAGGTPVFVQTRPEDGYLMSAEQLRAAITPRTRALVLNTPSNPTGACYPEAQLRELGLVVAEVVRTQPMIVVSDEVYEYLTYDGFVHRSFLAVNPELRECTIHTNAFSKSYAMTGWRVGYAAGPQKLIDAIATHASQLTSNVCSIAQYAATAAYSDNGAFPKMMLEEFTKRREIVVNSIDKMPGIRLACKPLGGFFAFLLIDGLVGKKCGNVTVTSGQSFADYLLSGFDVVAVQGEAFGFQNSIRLSFAMSQDQLEKGLDRISKAAISLQ